MAVNIYKTKFLIFHSKGKKFTKMLYSLTMITNLGKIYHCSFIPLNASTLIIPTQNAEVIKSLEYLKKNLTFDYHTNHIIDKLNHSLYCMNNVHHFLPKTAIEIPLLRPYSFPQQLLSYNNQLHLKYQHKKDISFPKKGNPNYKTLKRNNKQML